jgi:aryl-alcohol dehydrogenase-like predicted oxidoreductase
MTVKNEQSGSPAVSTPAARLSHSVCRELPSSRETARSAEDAAPAGAKTLERRRLGRLGWKVSALGLGGAGLHGVCGKPSTDAQAVATVHAALEGGVNYIDTSPGYGESERRLGLALRGYPREQVYLASKTGTGIDPRDYTADTTLWSVERSLKRLGTDYLDLMQIHDPDDARQAFSLGALTALQKLKDQKVIRGIGIGVRCHQLLLGAIEGGQFDAILTYADFNLVYQHAREDLFEPAVRHDVGIVLGSPLYFGYLTDVPWEQMLKQRGAAGEREEEQLALRARQFAQRHDVSTVHLGLQYCLSDRRIGTVLMGAETPEEVHQNLKAATTPLPAPIWSALESELGVK